ncbi:MAG: hypothetical protein ABIE74_01480 [Pseudomonadota bacterium]
MLDCQPRKANWLPLPEGVGRLTISQQISEADETDLFPKAILLNYWPNSRKGTILTDKGDELTFDLTYTDIIRGREDSDFNIGAKVGYDSSNVGKKKRVTKVKIY